MTHAYQDLAKMIDHSLLHPTMSSDVFEQGINVALAYEVASVCIMPHYLKRCAERLAGSTVIASTVIGFPHGGHTTAGKVAETKQAISDGCQEFDMVCNISRVVSGDWGYVKADIQAVTDAVHEAGQKVKIIFENCYLDESQKIRLCEISNDLKVDWIKTSTGFGTSGATIDDLRLMLKHAAEGIQVKAAGGVRDLETLIKVRELGVTRVGTSRSEGLLDPVREQQSLPPIDVSAVDVAGDY